MFSINENPINGKVPKPIAFIQGGKYDKEVIYVHDDPDDSLFYEIDLTEDDINAKIKPIHAVNGRISGYFAGSAGSGKSTMMAEYIKSYKKLYPHRTVYIISRTDFKHDPAFKDLKMTQLNITKPIDFVKEGYQQCMFVFDDVSTFSDKEMQQNIFHLIKDLLEVARKNEISVLISNHLINPNEKSLGRVIMNELDLMCIFPRGASRHHIKYALHHYFGVSNQIINRILNSSSRYVIISKNYPNYVLEEQHAYPLHD
ncbi:MAG: ATP-binding protein [Campylobacterales bacterium]|nr:ATP-binding protein [Campylobacterales bacterium]